MVYDAFSRTLRFYVGGKLAGDEVEVNGVFATSGALQIGRALINGTFGEYFAGTVDDVRVYAGNIDATTVQLLSERAGVPVSISTDDRTVSDLTLVRELTRCTVRLGIDPATIASVVRHAYEAAFLHDDERTRTRLLAAFDDWFATNPPPAVRTVRAANCAAPEKTTRDITIGATEPMTGCASTPKEIPPANVGRTRGRPFRSPGRRSCISRYLTL